MRSVPRQVYGSTERDVLLEGVRQVQGDGFRDAHYTVHDLQKRAGAAGSLDKGEMPVLRILLMVGGGLGGGFMFAYSSWAGL